MTKPVHKHQVDTAGELVQARDTRAQDVAAIAREVRSAVNAGASELPGALVTRVRSGADAQTLRVQPQEHRALDDSRRAAMRLFKRPCRKRSDCTRRALIPEKPPERSRTQLRSAPQESRAFGSQSAGQRAQARSRHAKSRTAIEQHVRQHQRRGE